MSIFGNLFKRFNVNYYESDKLYKAFDVKPCISDFERDLISDWRDIYIDKAPWLTDGGSYNINTLETYLHGGNEILRSLGFAKSICEEIARLSTLELNIEVIGSGRATYIQTNYIDDLKNDLQNIIELMAAVGFVVLKPGIDDTDLITPFDLIPIRYDKKKLNEVIFIDKIERDNDILIRCEHHNYIDEEKYIIRNKAFLSKDKSFDMQEIPLNSIPEWSEIKEKVNLKGLEHPLYVVLSMPTANNIDIHSKIAMSCFSGVTQQLEDLDVAYTNFAHEVYNSNKVMFLSQFVIDNTKAKRTKLPDFVKGLEFGVGAENTVQEFNPECDGMYKLETWGAQGGSKTNSGAQNSKIIGGYGGYSTGNIDLTENVNSENTVNSENAVNQNIDVSVDTQATQRIEILSELLKDTEISQKEKKIDIINIEHLQQVILQRKKY